MRGFWIRSKFRLLDGLLIHLIRSQIFILLFVSSFVRCSYFNCPCFISFVCFFIYTFILSSIHHRFIQLSIHSSTIHPSIRASMGSFPPLLICSLAPSLVCLCINSCSVALSLVLFILSSFYPLIQNSLPCIYSFVFVPSFIQSFVRSFCAIA